LLEGALSTNLEKDSNSYTTEEIENVSSESLDDEDWDDSEQEGEPPWIMMALMKSHSEGCFGGGEGSL
jgi:hypothetical protein